MLMGHVREIDWDDMKIAFPAFLTIVLMPLSYSIAYGVLTGILANITLWLFIGAIDMCRALWRRDGVTTPRTVSESHSCACAAVAVVMCACAAADVARVHECS